jgi:large-conductance mechanosensitive channel
MLVGITVGAVFGEIVDSLVKDIIMHLIGLFLGDFDFINFFIVLKEGKFVYTKEYMHIISLTPLVVKSLSKLGVDTCVKDITVFFVQ